MNQSKLMNHTHFFNAIHCMSLEALLKIEVQERVLLEARLMKKGFKTIEVECATLFQIIRS